LHQMLKKVVRLLKKNFNLKVPKCEIFGFGFFALIRPIWIGD
jgi:hypothetical protein